MTRSDAAKRYYREFGLSMAAYVVVLVGSLTWLNALGTGNPWRYALAVLPVLPGIGVVVAYIRFLRDMDELQHRIQVEALGIAFTVTFLVTFTYGFLENAGLPKVSAIWVTPVMILSWGLASAAVSRRFA
jgi:hypothetical protein